MKITEKEAIEYIQFVEPDFVELTAFIRRLYPKVRITPQAMENFYKLNKGAMIPKLRPNFNRLRNREKMEIIIATLEKFSRKINLILPSNFSVTTKKEEESKKEQVFKYKSYWSGTSTSDRSNWR